MLRKFRERYKRTYYGAGDFDKDNIENNMYGSSLEACYLFSKEFGIDTFVFVCHGMFWGKIAGKWYLKYEDFYIDPFERAIILDPEENFYDSVGMKTWIRKKIVFEGKVDESMVKSIEEYYKEWFVNWPIISDEYLEYWRRNYLEIVDFFIKNRAYFPRKILLRKGRGISISRDRVEIPTGLNEEDFVKTMKKVALYSKGRENVFRDEVIFWIMGRI